MRRRLTIATLLLGVVAGACNDSNSPASPTRPGPVRPVPAPTAKFEGTMTVATSHTATGGVRYTTQIQLTETNGVAVTVTGVELAPTDAWGPYEAFATFGPEAWTDGNVISAHGTLTSKPLVATEELPSSYLYQVEARIFVGEGGSASTRTFSLYADAPPIPQPPPTARLTLIGVVVEGWDAALSDVTVEVLNGDNIGRKARTDSEGRYTITGLRAGEFTVQASKAGYGASATALDLKSNRTLPFYLEPKTQ